MAQTESACPVIHKVRVRPATRSAVANWISYRIYYRSTCLDPIDTDTIQWYSHCPSQEPSVKHDFRAISAVSCHIPTHTLLGSKIMFLGTINALDQLSTSCIDDNQQLVKIGLLLPPTISLLSMLLLVPSLLPHTCTHTHMHTQTL